jgi:hypothetical protein
MMMMLKHCGFLAERGSVLMETILAIPLFIAFLSGIFVLGDLMLGRNRLTAADRFAVWLAGSRLADRDDDGAKESASEGFFRSGEFAQGTRIRSFKSQKQRVSWHMLVSGTSELKINLPVWASGTRKSTIKILDDGNGSMPDTDLWNDVSFKARAVEDEAHSVLMRTRYDTREESGQRLAMGGPLWHSEYRTAYFTREGSATDRPRSQGDACDGMQYIRYPFYVGWSK